MLKTFEAFSGYGSHSLELDYLEIDNENVGIAEVDIEAIIAYGVLRYRDVPFEHPTVEKMREELMYCDVGWDFKKEKSRIPRLPVKKLNLLYKYHVLSKNVGNIATIEGDDVVDHDLFTYSFPCQDISNAGNQRGLEKGSGTQSSLIWECERIIEIKQPKFLMMENVKNLVGKKNKPHFDEWLRLLEKLGYNNYWKVLNAKWCGVPQNRKRVFVMSIRKDVDDGSFHFNEEFDNGLRLKDILETEVDEKYYLSEMIQNRFTYRPSGKNVIDTTKGEDCTRIGNRDEVYHSEGVMGTLLATDYKQPKQLMVKQATKQGYDIAYEGDSINIEQPNSKTRRGRVGKGVANTLTTSCNQAVIDPNIEVIGRVDLNGHDLCKRIYDQDGISPTVPTVPTGQSGNTIPKIIKLSKESGNHYGGGLYSKEGISPSLVSSGDGGGTNNLPKISVNELRIRKLTPRECGRLMGVEDEDIDLIQSTGVSNSQLYKLFGNSIVTNQMEFLKNLEAMI